METPPTFPFRDGFAYREVESDYADFIRMLAAAKIQYNVVLRPDLVTVSIPNSDGVVKYGTGGCVEFTFTARLGVLRAVAGWNHTVPPEVKPWWTKSQAWQVIYRVWCRIRHQHRPRLEFGPYAPFKRSQRCMRCGTEFHYG